MTTRALKHAIRLAVSLTMRLAVEQAAVAASPQTEAEFRRAQVLFRQRHGLQARAILEQLADKRDANAAIYCLLADTYLAEGNDISDNLLAACENLANRALQLDSQC